MLILKCKEMNYMKRKEIVGVLLFVIVMVGLFQFAVKRIEKIENQIELIE
jgi:hypothetical protein